MCFGYSFVFTVVGRSLRSLPPLRVLFPELKNGRFFVDTSRPPGRWNVFFPEKCLVSRIVSSVYRLRLGEVAQ